MTNAQAALIAAAIGGVIAGSYSTTSDIEARAERHMQWLDKQDRAADERANQELKKSDG